MTGKPSAYAVCKYINFMLTCTWLCDILNKINVIMPKTVGA